MTEPARPQPDFSAYVERDGVRIDVTHAVMDVYDIAVNSMDFGSGFLSTEEVGNLRALGKAIGAQRFDYQNDRCLRCGHDFGRHYLGTGQDSAATVCAGEYHNKYPRQLPDCSCTQFVRPTN